jgi:hypothetical protein
MTLTDKTLFISGASRGIGLAIGEDVLEEEGVTDFDEYAYSPGAEPQVDMFVDHV